MITGATRIQKTMCKREKEVQFDVEQDYKEGDTQQVQVPLPIQADAGDTIGPVKVPEEYADEDDTTGCAPFMVEKHFSQHLQIQI